MKQASAPFVRVGMVFLCYILFLFPSDISSNALMTGGGLVYLDYEDNVDKDRG